MIGYHCVALAWMYKIQTYTINCIFAFQLLVVVLLGNSSISHSSSDTHFIIFLNVNSFFIRFILFWANSYHDLHPAFSKCSHPNHNYFDTYVCTRANPRKEFCALTICLVCIKPYIMTIPKM